MRSLIIAVLLVVCSVNAWGQKGGTSNKENKISFFVKKYESLSPYHKKLLPYDSVFYAKEISRDSMLLTNYVSLCYKCVDESDVVGILISNEWIADRYPLSSISECGARKATKEEVEAWLRFKFLWSYQSPSQDW